MDCRDSKGAEEAGIFRFYLTAVLPVPLMQPGLLGLLEGQEVKDLMTHLATPAPDKD